MRLIAPHYPPYHVMTRALERLSDLSQDAGTQVNVA